MCFRVRVYAKIVTDVFNKSQRSKIMAAVRSRGNRSTELALVAAFKERRIIGWRRHYSIFGNPDFVFPKTKLVIFVDGCFWHGCPKCGSLPATNRDYWKTKIARNAQRDKARSRALRAQGWTVLRIWEHDLRVRRIASKIRVIEKTLARLHTELA